MKCLPPEQSFLGLPAEKAIAYEDARAVVIPFGLEASVSYGTGTAKAPSAILQASAQIELYDEQLGYEPYYNNGGIVTLAPVKISESVPTALDQLDQQVSAVLADNKFPLVLGGEHTITVGAIRPFTRQHKDLAVLHFDAHADLRDQYADNPYSHATALRRCLDASAISTLVSCGIRSISAEEIPFLNSNSHRIHMHWAKDKAHWKLDDIVAPLRGKTIYLTFDIDAFDSSVMPATGTPEPGGLFWDDVMAIIAEAAKVGHIVGADVNELSPIQSLHACDFLAAKLVYKILGFSLSKAHSTSKCNNNDKKGTATF